MQDAPLLLADIHLAPPVSPWPFAIGWWFMVFLALILVMTVVIWLYKGFKQKQFSKQARRYLLAQPELEAQQVNELIKIVAMHYCPSNGLPRLTGPRWYQWLEQHAMDQSGQELAALLARYQYKAVAMPKAEQEHLRQLAAAWLQQAWRLAKKISAKESV